MPFLAFLFFCLAKLPSSTSDDIELIQMQTENPPFFRIIHKSKVYSVYVHVYKSVLRIYVFSDCIGVCVCGDDVAGVRRISSSILLLLLLLLFTATTLLRVHQRQVNRSRLCGISHFYTASRSFLSTFIICFFCSLTFFVCFLISLKKYLNEVP